MKKFTNGQRVTVTDSESLLCGKQGRVCRLRICDNGAFVDMDDNLPAELQLFPDGDSRQRHTMLYPEQCAAATIETGAAQ